MQTTQEYLNKLVTSKNAINRLQKDIDKIYEWSIANNMCFNSHTLEIIIYSFSNGPVINHEYLANDGSEVIEKKHMRDLDVTNE